VAGQFVVWADLFARFAFKGSGVLRAGPEPWLGQWPVRLHRPGQYDVAAASGQADEGGIVAFTLSAFAVVERFGGGVAQGCERG
jgi:hypothetical protein